MFKDNFFNKIEKKTNINKETILSLATKLQNNNMKNENAIKEVIQDICNLTGKEISKEKEKKIIEAIINDNVPKNIDKMF